MFYFLKHFKKHDKKGTYCFPWTEETIGNDLSACGGYGETESLIFLDVLFRTSGASIDILEHLIETEFTESLERVTNPGWDEALYKINGEKRNNSELTVEKPTIPSVL